MKFHLCIVSSLLLFLYQYPTFAQNTSSLNKLTYRIGYFDTPPLSFKNTDSQQPEGLAIDIMKAIANEHQFKIEWVYDDFPNLIEMIKSKQIDGLTGAGFSLERADYMDYSEINFSNVWGQVFLPIDSKIESLFDLEGKMIALMENDVNGINFIKKCDQFEIKCIYRYGNSYQEIFKLISDGHADAAVSNNLAGIDFQKQFPMSASSIVFNPFKVYITVPKGLNDDLLTKYDDSMRFWKQNPNSYYYQARLKWSGKQQESTIPMWVWYSIMGLVLFGIIAGIAAILFKKQVKHRVKELTQREIQFNQIINIVPHMIFANQNDGKMILANENTCRFFGIDNEEIETKNIHDILKSKANFKNLISYTNSSNPFNTEVAVKDSEGNAKTLMMSKVPYSGRNQSEPAVVTVGVDITQIKAYEKEIMYLAHFDSLTGLPNRELLKDRLKSSLARANQFNHVGGIIHLDLDNFKNINDSQGHKVGDKLIKKVAMRIKACISPGDTLAHLGGDEFIIELPELKNDLATAQKQALEMGNIILDKIKKPIKVKQNHYHMTASAGLVIYPRDGDTQSLLLQRADTALYEAKFKGRNRIQVFDTGIESRVKKNHLLENDLRHAVQNKEINILYQPIVNAKDETMVGSEILLRWNHPREGTIMPTDFIPIAERSQLILEIGYWTIKQACKQIVKWRAHATKPFFIAVNLSVIQIRDKNFLQNVTELIHAFQIPNNYLEFEVTESILLNESKRSIEIIKQLKMLGIKLSIDDFGTGYSSFDYIRKLPLDKIKIDKSFIQDIPEDVSSTAIVKTILAMADEMQLEVVAEGVELEGQIEFLQQHNCQYFQGYYFSKPKSEEQLLSNHKF